MRCLLCVLQAYAILGNVMSLVGGFASISCSLLMPSLFYLILFWKELGITHRTGQPSLCPIQICKSCRVLGYNCVAIALAGLPSQTTGSCAPSICQRLSFSCFTWTGVVVLLVVGSALLVLIVGQNVIDIAQKVDHDDKGVNLAQSATSVLGRLVEGL